MTKRKAPSSCIAADGSAEEPVLVVPPHRTQSSYALLVKHGLVPRKWHLEGRYGSRTFRPSDYASPPTPTSPKRKVAKEATVSKDGGASDAIKHNETGLICDGNNLDDIYSSIDLILKNNSYKEFGQKAKQFSNNFHWDKIIKEYLKLL